MARHDPRRVLRDIAAKLLLLTTITDMEHCEEQSRLLRSLAAAYDWHPDYDEAWCI